MQTIALIAEELAPPAGIEPATCGLEVRRSIRLSYRGLGTTLPRLTQQKLA